MIQFQLNLQGLEQGHGLEAKVILKDSKLVLKYMQRPRPATCIPDNGCMTSLSFLQPN